MKVLHLFSMAGVAEMLCEEGDKVIQLEQLDPFGFAEYYGVTGMWQELEPMIRWAEFHQEEYDKIVIHDYHEFKDRFPKDKVILYFHGSKLRGLDEIELTQVKEYPCIVTTSDLLDILPNATYLQVPIDLELFKPEFGKEKGDKWLCINRSYQKEYIKDKITEKYPDILYWERTSDRLIDYEDMPMFLAQCDHYVDWKFDYNKPDPRTLPDLSCTGLQAMAVGCTVHNSNGTVNNPLLLVLHDKKRIAERFREEIG